MMFWGADWAWSLPLILLTVVIHVFGLGLINERVVRALSRSMDRRRLVPLFALVMGVAALLVTALHAIEGVAWAAAYLFLGAMPDAKSAMLYSLNAMTTYGHESASLAPPWQMMGALEALNGIVLFGLTTAFLFAMIQEVWPRTFREGHRNR
jgi:MFS superfamily sulfate permease-like transporter